MAQLLSNIQVTNERTSYDNTQNPGSQVLSKLGKPQRKSWFSKADTAAVLFAWALFVAARITVLGIPACPSIPWHLGVTKQFQIIGACLGFMPKCFHIVAPKLFLLLEAEYFGSYLQNYEAILRNSFRIPKTHRAWQAILMILILIPSGLGVLYKTNDHGVGHFDRNSAGNFYGMTPPAGIQNTNIGFIGLSLMANSTLPFASATFDDPELPLFPKPYGFNILLLSNTSSARLDLPVPNYLQILQEQLEVNEAYTLTAHVHGVVTTYNDSIEAHRDDDCFWNYYLSMTGDDSKDRYISAINQSVKDTFLVSKLDSQDLHNDYYENYSISLLMNDLQSFNTSWTFVTFLNAPANDVSADRKAALFRSSAMLFQTRRENCTATWRITYNSIQLVNGSCDNPRLPDQSQLMFTNATFPLQMRTWYLPMLCEYLEAFANTRNASHWKVPSFVTVIGGMYWSRLSKLVGPQNEESHRGQSPQDIYYHVQDILVSEKRVMNNSRSLWFALAFFPALTTAAFLGRLAFFRVLFDAGGFGTVALLAGVRPDTLALLDGASVSGKLKKRVRVRVEGRKGEPQVEYILIDNTHDGGGTSPGWWQKISGGMKYRPIASEKTGVPHEVTE